MRKFIAGRGAVLKMFSGSVAIQAMLSASNFAVGLILVRRTTDAQYGYYVLITTGILLLVALQWAFVGPATIMRFSTADRAQRADIIGGISRAQRTVLPFFVLAALILAGVLLATGSFNVVEAVTLVAGSIAAVAALDREFFRTVMFAFQRPNDVLKGDVVYCVLLIGGAYLATLSPWPAATAAITLSVASLAAALVVSRVLWRYAPWNRKASMGIIGEIAGTASWSAFGSGTHWLFSQGYNYLVAGSLDIRAVAAMAATRLLVMPVNLLSTGIGNLMLPSVARWNRNLKGTTVFGRLALAATGIAGLSFCYLGVMWLGRDWIFHNLLKKDLAQRDSLLMLWSVISIVMVYRDQLLHYLVSHSRFRTTSALTLFSAIVAACSTLMLIPRMGAVGALVGLLIGELVNILGILIMSLREARAFREPVGSTSTP